MWGSVVRLSSTSPPAPLLSLPRHAKYRAKLAFFLRLFLLAESDEPSNERHQRDEHTPTQS